MYETYETALDDAMVRLQVARKMLHDEITNYPAPISGCDIYFNTLLADRSRISKSIQALEYMPFVPTPRIQERGGLSESR